MDYAAKRARVEHLYAIADGEATQLTPGGSEPTSAGITRSPTGHRGRLRAAYTRPHGARHCSPPSTWPRTSSTATFFLAQFTALRYYPLDGTDHAGHKEQSSMIHR